MNRAFATEFAILALSWSGGVVGTVALTFTSWEPEPSVTTVFTMPIVWLMETLFSLQYALQITKGRPMQRKCVFFFQVHVTQWWRAHKDELC